MYRQFSKCTVLFIFIAFVAFAGAVYSQGANRTPRAGEAVTKTITATYGSFDLTMVYIPAGSFQMGELGRDDSDPVHMVTGHI